MKEVSTAVIEVGNGMFGRKWKNPEGSEESFDIHTLPNIRNIRIALQQIETQSLSLVVDMLMMEKEKGRMVIHASDSTTKKGVGQFIVQGLHVGQDCPYPLPILTLCPSLASMERQLRILPCRWTWGWRWWQQ